MSHTTVGKLADEDRVAATLTAGGLAPRAARGSARRFVQCAERLLAEGWNAATTATALHVPGRIEVLGKHTDYGGGRSILAATEQGFAMIAVERDDATVRLFDVRLSKEAAFVLTPDLAPEPGRWTNYPMTAARRLVRNFPATRSGADIVIRGNLPLAAGLSTSSALITGVLLLLAETNGLPGTEAWQGILSNEEELAGYLGCVENGSDFGPLEGDSGVGTSGGSEDHTAILCARPGSLVAYEYAPVRLIGEVPLPTGHILAVGASGVRASKTGAARSSYNRASRLLELFLDMWNRTTGQRSRTVKEAVQSHGIDEDRLLEVADRAERETGEAGLIDRLRHFLIEDGELVPAAFTALEDGDLEAFGRLAERSQHWAEELLGNQVPQTIALARTAVEIGAVASSAFGAGFGGSVWALVGQEDVRGFLAEWKRRYLGAFPDKERDSMFFSTGAGPSAFMLD